MIVSPFFVKHYWISKIYALLSQNFVVRIYALFLQIFLDWKVKSADIFTFWMYAEKWLARPGGPQYHIAIPPYNIEIQIMHQNIVFLLWPLRNWTWKFKSLKGNKAYPKFLAKQTERPNDHLLVKFEPLDPKTIETWFSDQLIGWIGCISQDTYISNLCRSSS